MLGVFIGMGLSILMVTLLAFTPAPSSIGNITRVADRDGMTVYHYNGYVIVKTSNSVSISK